MLVIIVIVIVVTEKTGVENLTVCPRTVHCGRGGGCHRGGGRMETVDVAPELKKNWAVSAPIEREWFA